ncbi:MAG: hypothetical protein ACMXYG_06165 [Candidatus Woesearchaeota archaeon]
MKKKLILTLTLMVMLFVIGCSQNNIIDNGPSDLIDDSSDDIVFCAQDVKECPDGSFVARNPDDNCNFFECPESEIILDSAIIKLKENYNELTSYEYYDEEEGFQVQIRDDIIIVWLRNLVDIPGTTFRYNTIYFIDGTAYAYCVNNRRYNGNDCNLANLRRHTIIDYDKHYPQKLASDWITELDNAVIGSTVSCENRRCVVVEFEKQNKNYLLEANELYSLPYRVFEIDSEGRQNRVARYSSAAFNNLRPGDMNPPSDTTLIEI